MFTMPNRLYRQFVLAMGTAALAGYVVYLVFPTYVTKPAPEQVPGDHLLADLLRQSYEVDAAASTHNAAPSQHVFYALINMCFVIRWRPRPRVFVTWVTLAALICASTLLTMRHNSPDLLTGYLFAIGGYYAGLYLGGRVTDWLGDEDGPIVLPEPTLRLQQRLRQRLQRLGARLG
jgi:membrane-associated phospholipid phosphatase